MVLKEAFRYQKYLNELIYNATMYLSYPENVTNKTQTHLRHAVNKEAEDETVTAPKRTCFENSSITPNDVVKFVVDLYDEKEKLIDAIAAAKLSAKVNIDTSIEKNKVRQQLSSCLNELANTRSSENITVGQAKKFNADGEQVSYTYDVKEVITIDFDRNMVKAINKKMKETSDKTSAEIEMANITVEVNYTPKYDLDDTFEDCITQFMS